ncbi:zinc ribbon domain-containing protein [Altererythrobacter fulvus]|uniref:zinc ribbon domain-containing protein n=1 Tax=Caenibius fulvus TaxID=2126012 RepID=UPI0030194A3E
MQRCGTCGADNREGVRFCTSCGSQLVLELLNELTALPELELRSPTPEASGWWRSSHRAAAMQALQPLLPVGTVEPFAQGQGWAGFTGRCGSDAAAFIPGRTIEGTMLTDMFDAGGGAGLHDETRDRGEQRASLVAVWERLRLHDGLAGGLERHVTAGRIPLGRIEAPSALKQRETVVVPKGGAH